MRARISRDLISRCGFNLVAIEGDWPDTAVLDRYVRGLPNEASGSAPFRDFPNWLWRNVETSRFVDWLARYNAEQSALNDDVRLYGLDLYSLNRSIRAVLEYLDRVDPEAAQATRRRFACFTPWEADPAIYGRATNLGESRGCGAVVETLLHDLARERVNYLKQDGDAFFDAERNATLVREAERYYRSMYVSSCESWNLRDRHMFDTLRGVLDHHGPGAKAIVWAHNAHVGNARATEMGARGELSIGQLVHEFFRNEAYSIGFGSHAGTVAAAPNWNQPVQTMSLRPSHRDSYENLFHATTLPKFLLPLRGTDRRELVDALAEPRLERAIGAVYRADSAVPSHYFQASLPGQFDEFIWFDHTSAVHPIDPQSRRGADTYPFAL